jgi:uncharacterized protein (DUF1330 family)
MAAYIVALVRIKDPVRFQDYVKGIAGLSEKFGGQPLVRGQSTAFLEGEGEPGERVIVSRFPDAASARAYLASPEYVAARQARVGAADVTIRLVEEPS